MSFFQQIRMISVKVKPGHKFPYFNKNKLYPPSLFLKNKQFYNKKKFDYHPKKKYNQLCAPSVFLKETNKYNLV